MHTPLTRELFKGLAAKGELSYGEIAKTLGIGRRTAMRWAKKMKVGKRVRGQGSPAYGKEKVKTSKRDINPIAGVGKG